MSRLKPLLTLDEAATYLAVVYCKRLYPGYYASADG
jgi:hypothetical protein